MPPPDPPLPVVFGRAEATAAGLSADQVARRLRANRWMRLRRGQYGVDLAEHMRWRAEIVAHLRAHARTLVLSHAHAARAWGLPSPLGGWGPPSFTAPSGSTRRGDLLVRVAPLADHDVEHMEQVLVTTPARTIADCSRNLPGRDALAMADHALHVGLVTHAQLQSAVEAQQGWPGAKQGRRVLALADGRRETPIESWSAWTFEELGVPRPRWQVTVLDADGVFVGRVDALWEGHLAGEADGRAKYGANGQGPDDVVAAVHAERRRETGLRRTGLGVARWGTPDLLSPRRAIALALHIRRELTVDRAVSARLLEL